MKDRNTKRRDAVTAIIELMRSNPHFKICELYQHLESNRAELNLWTKGAYGLTVSQYVGRVLKGKSVLPLKHFHVKHYVELTEAGSLQMLKAIGGSLTGICRAATTHGAAVVYGAINEQDMLCVELSVGPTDSKLIYTNYVLRDTELFRVVPYTTPGVLLGIQNRNLGLEY